MFNYEILLLLSNYCSKIDFLNLINTCKNTRKHEQLFIDKFGYTLDYQLIDCWYILFRPNTYSHFISFLNKIDEIYFI